MSWHKFISCHIVFNKHWLITAWYFWTTRMLFLHHSGKDRNISAAVWWTVMNSCPATMIIISLLLLYPSPPLFQELHVWWPCCLIRSWRWLMLETHAEFFAIKTAMPFLYRTTTNLTSSRSVRGSRRPVSKCAAIQTHTHFSLYSEQQKRLQLKLEGASKLTLLLWKHEMSLLMIKAKSHCTVLPLIHLSLRLTSKPTDW